MSLVTWPAHGMACTRLANTSLVRTRAQTGTRLIPAPAAGYRNNSIPVPKWSVPRRDTITMGNIACIEGRRRRHEQRKGREHETKRTPRRTSGRGGAITASFVNSAALSQWSFPILGPVYRWKCADQGIRCRHHFHSRWWWNVSLYQKWVSRLECCKA